MGGCAHLGVTGPLSARSSPHIDPVEVHTPVGPGPRGDEAVTMLAGRGHWGVGWCQGPPHLRDLGERWGAQLRRPPEKVPWPGSAGDTLGARWGPLTHTWHCVLILDDDLPQEPAFIVLIHVGRAGRRGGARS